MRIQRKKERVRIIICAPAAEAAGYEKGQPAEIGPGDEPNAIVIRTVPVGTRGSRKLQAWGSNTSETKPLSLWGPYIEGCPFTMEDNDKVSVEGTDLDIDPEKREIRFNNPTAVTENLQTLVTPAKKAKAE